MPIMISDFPNELILELIYWFPLKSLIAVCGINRTWRQFVLLSNIAPARRALLDLYFDAIESDTFHLNRALCTPPPVTFDREAYVATLENQIGGTLPDGMCIYEELKTMELTWN
jgi:hypothetical protein